MRGLYRCAVAIVVVGLVACSSCSRRNRDSASIKITGSDTMVNLAQAWQDRYKKVRPGVSVQVKGGGSGVGIAALCEGNVEIATSSRKIKKDEIELAKKNTGKEPKEFKVGDDALAIYVHPDNPSESITIAQLAAIYGEGGAAEKWSDLDVENTSCPNGQIIRVSRQNSSGTYLYFREAVLGENGNYKQGATSGSGSSDVIGLVSRTPCAIGYSGMGYRTDAVKMLKVAKDREPPVAPTIEAVLDRTYPISRPLFIYTLGEPEGHVQDLIDWILSDAGQKVVEESGYVPLSK
jgi:phosphate transport system substrate-binding protein